MYLENDQRAVMVGGTKSRHGEKAIREDAKKARSRRRRIIALLLGRLSRARLKDAIGRDDELIFVSSVSELRAEIGRANCALTIVVEARDCGGAPTSPLLRELVAQCPAIATIGYSIASARSTDILELANAGIDELVQEGLDDTRAALRAAFSGSLEACAARAVRAAIGYLIPVTLRPLVDYCLHYPRDDHSVEGLSIALGVDRKTLLNYSQRVNLPPPSALTMWCRLLLAAAILEGSGLAVERVALLLDFASPSALRNACRRYTGERPSQWKSPGGLARVVRHFATACGRARSF